MAATTPAWTERYVKLLDTAIGRVLAERPVGTEARTDPLTAVDRFGFASRLVLLLGVRAAVCRDHAWSRLTFTAHSPTEFIWTPDEIANSVASRLQRPDGCTDGGRLNGSLLAAAALGLRLAGHSEPDQPWPMPDEHAGHAGHAERLCTILLISALAGEGQALDLLVDRALGEVVAALRTGGSVDGETAAVALALAREFDRNDIVRSLSERSNGRFEDEAAASHPTAAALAATSGPGRLRSLTHGIDQPLGAVVDLDEGVASLSRAEWIDGALLLRLLTVDEDPGAWMTFRITGAEPRLWYLTGIDRSWMDVTSSAVIMRVPRVSGTLELTPGSY